VTLFFGRPDLLRQFRAGERAALEEVYWAYLDCVEAIARRGFMGVSGTDPQNVPDVVQQSFVRAFSEQSRMGFDGLREYGPFVATIARHTLADWWRRHGKLQALGDDLDTVARATETSASRQPEDDYADAQTVRIVETYLATLDPPLRAVHEELYVKGRPQREAALALGISRQSLRTLDKRLRKGLEAALAAAKVG